MTNHCENKNVTDLVPLIKAAEEETEQQETASQRGSQPHSQPGSEPGAHEAEFYPIEEERPYRDAWLGPVADTVLVDFLFYGLFIALPVLLLWILFGRWWLFRNMEWVALGAGLWFIIVWGWRRKQGRQ